MYRIDYENAESLNTIAVGLRESGRMVGNIIPPLIAKSMVNLIPDNWFEPKSDELIDKYVLDLDKYTNNHRVLDICCNSGILLVKFIDRFFTTLNSYKNFKDMDDCYDYIIQSLIYGICSDLRLCEEIRGVLYNNIDVRGNIFNYDIYSRVLRTNEGVVYCDDDIAFDIRNNKAFIYSKERKEKVEVKFNVICGNPPYNKDIYTDFVQLGHNMAKDYDLWITPAKWQSKNDDLSENMRTSISPYISDLVYYSNTQEVFSDVALDGGVAYYLVTRDTCKCRIKNVNDSKVDSTTVESLEVFDIKLSNLLDKLHKVNSKTIFSSELFTPQKSYFCGLETADPHLVVDDSSKYRLVNQKYNIGIPKDKCKNIENIDKYKCYATHYMNSSTTYFKLKPYEVSTRGNILLYFGSEEECDSALSYYKSNLVRYLCIATGLGSVCKECFKFVPDPVSFDKIYEDKPLKGYKPNKDGEYLDKDYKLHCSLYVKYGLTEEEINIIELTVSVKKGSE